MKNRPMIFGLALVLVGGLVALVSPLGWATLGIGLLLTAFGLGVAEGVRQRHQEDRIELDRLFEDSLQFGRLASFIEIPESAMREMAALGAERYKMSGPLEKPDPAPDADEPTPLESTPKD